MTTEFKGKETDTHTQKTRKERGREKDDRHQDPDLKSLMSSTNLHFLIYGQVEKEATAELNLSGVTQTQALLVGKPVSHLMKEYLHMHV